MTLVCVQLANSIKEKTTFDWAAREQELRDLCDRFRRSDGSNDVLVPSSGGKDSAYVAHQLKHRYGMNPLTITWAPHIYTDIGFKNFENHIHIGDLDNLKITPSGGIHRKLTKLCTEILGDPFLPFIFGQNNLPLRLAEKLSIPLIFYGENSEVEYGGSMSDAYVPTRDWTKMNEAVFMSGLGPDKLVDYGIDKNQLYWYRAPDKEILHNLGLEIHYMSYYHHWKPQYNFYYCAEHTGFNPKEVDQRGPTLGMLH